MKNLKIFLRTDDETIQKVTRETLRRKDYVSIVVEDIANAEEKQVDIAIIGLNNHQGKLLSDKIRELIPGVRIIPFFSDYVDYGDINTVRTEIGRLDEIIAQVLREKEVKCRK